MPVLIAHSGLGKAMLEAVNSVLSNAQYTRVAAEQHSVLNSFAANPDRVQQAPTVAPYLSLHIKVDNNFDKAVLQIRDNQSGDVLRQIPTESQLEAYRRAQTSNSVRQAEPAEMGDVYTDAPEDVSVSPSPDVVKTSEASVSSQPQSAPQVQAQPQAQTVSIDTQA